MARRAPVQPDVDDPPPGSKTKRLRSGNADVDAAAALLEWARRRGYAVGPQLVIGTLSVQIRDLRLLKREAMVDPADEEDDDEDMPGGILDEHGAPKEAPAEGTTG